MNAMVTSQPGAGSTVADRLSAAGTANALELRGVTKMFGALAALSDITPQHPAGRAPRRARLQRCGQDHPLQLHHRRLLRDLGHHPVLRRGRHPFSRLRAHPPRSPPHLSDLACCSPASRCWTMSTSPAAASPAVAFSLIRPRRNDVLMASAEDLVAAVHLTDVKDSEGRHPRPRPAASARNRPRPRRRTALHPVRRTRRRPVADRAQRADRDPDLAPLAHRLHHHRARHGRGAPRGRACLDDAQWPHLQGRHA